MLSNFPTYLKPYQLDKICIRNPWNSQDKLLDMCRFHNLRWQLLCLDHIVFCFQDKEDISFKFDLYSYTFLKDIAIHRNDLVLSKEWVSKKYTCLAIKHN